MWSQAVHFITIPFATLLSGIAWKVKPSCVEFEARKPDTRSLQMARCILMRVVWSSGGSARIQLIMRMAQWLRNVSLFLQLSERASTERAAAPKTRRYNTRGSTK